MEKILLQDILPLDELSKQGKVLLIRHQKEYLTELIDRDLIERYQSFQNKKNFRDSEYIVSFVAEKNNQARLFGIYKKIGIKEKDELPSYGVDFLEKVCNPQDKEKDFYLELEKIKEFEKYENRIIIDWVAPSRTWHNEYGKVQDKEIVKILPRDFIMEFIGIMNIKISASKLHKIINSRQTEWYEALTRLQAVYLILDISTGKQYVGTTYGEKGLWQRWKSYVLGDYTGGNKRLIELKESNKNFYYNIQFTVLEVLSKSATKEECLSAENNWKEKLGTRTFGLTAN